MKNRKSIFIAAICGALVEVLLMRSGALRTLQRLPFFEKDPLLWAHRDFWIAAVAILVVFSLYWEIAARSASRATRSESKISRAIHVTLANIGLLMVLAPLRGIGRFMPALPMVMGLGLTISFIGLLVGIWARRHLGRHWSGEITIKEDHQLIRSGPYRLMRHPIYTGILLLSFGCVLVTGEWLAIVGLSITVLAYARKILIEEKNLDKAFGADYALYREASWALFPGIF